MSKTIASIVLAAWPLMAAAQNGLAGQFIPVFPGGACDFAENYSDFYLGSGYPSCQTGEFDSSAGFQEVNGQFNATFLIPDPGDDCMIFIRAPSSVDNPQCGELINIFTEAKCATLVFPQPFDLNFCCGEEDCNNALPAGLKRSISQTGNLEKDWLDKVKPRSLATKAKRQSDYGDCSYAAAGDTFTQDGQAQDITGTLNCERVDGCTLQVTAGVQTGSTQSFGISETTEAGLFDIIQESITLSYTYEYSVMKTVQESFTYNIADGESGFISWAPTLQCTSGSFSGADCSAHGIPTETQGTSCIPMRAGNAPNGLPIGTSNFVAINE